MDVNNICNKVDTRIPIVILKYVVNNKTTKVIKKISKMLNILNIDIVIRNPIMQNNLYIA
jgi:hypothetical protein